ncbi:MAG: hypothetical protein Q8P89_00470 [bacterium]|nr:hypothetical protein [bacterium]
MINSAFYDISISYDDNFEKGPPVSRQKTTPRKKDVWKKHKFLGFEVNSLFGIPAGPLLNEKFMKAAFDFGFDVSTYKTVRSDFFPSHPFPNVLHVEIDGDLDPERMPQLVAKKSPSKSVREFSITNSFGVPSKKPEEWQEDVKKALAHAKDGQLLILSFMGTVKSNQTQEEFVDDFSRAAKLAASTGAKVLEANLSCPNIGNEGLVCYNLAVTEKVCQAVRREIGNLPLILKVGYYKNNNDLEKLAKIAGKYANAIAAINTLAVEVVDEKGRQALPGKNRLKSGICGASIKWAGIEMVDKLNHIRQKNKYQYSLVGIGGVMSPEDYFDYKKAGADLVQSATAAMWNPNLAYEIWEKGV